MAKTKEERRIQTMLAEKIKRRESKAAKESLYADAAEAVILQQRRQLEDLQRSNSLAVLEASKQLDGSSSKLRAAVQRMYPGFDPILALIEMCAHPQPVTRTNEAGEEEVVMQTLSPALKIKALSTAAEYLCRKPSREIARREADTQRQYVYEISIDGRDVISELAQEEKH